METGYYSLPSMVTRVGGNAEIIHAGENGELFAVEDISSCFEQLDKMESVGLKQYREKAKQNINDKFSIRTFERRLKNIYDIVLLK